MSNFLPTFPEASTVLGNLYIRQDLTTTHSVTVYFKDWTLWDVSTQQVVVSDSLIHFQQSDGEIVGVKILSNGGTR